ncbi:hypothetical protein Rsub_00509 [Raphidocelis subcapitata]|uniref:Uncharacterized protein n=1 Tax=Raphidocelis subcapitata TaxID=307507 RepID=A0A2V0NKG6_9CHLO|nr:hypothetical protein Rsub_00509 [Raphidocelis subcapitata]|eukprot:GBF87798.1 hypothetical protein Rsub_00509 [Raphidocelis subcapitata]
MEWQFCDLLDSLAANGSGALLAPAAAAAAAADRAAAAAAAAQLLSPSGGGGGGGGAAASDGTADGGAAETMTTAAEAYFGGLRARVASALAAAAAGDAAAVRGVLAAGIECLCAFLQHNVTGPMQPPAAPLWRRAGDAATVAAAAVAPGRERVDPDERWVASELEVDGEDLVGRLSAADRLLAALVCLAEPLGLATAAGPKRDDSGGSGGGEADGEAGTGAARLEEAERAAAPPPAGLGAWPWWAARALLLQQQALSGRSATVRSALLAATRAAVAWAQSLASSPAFAPHAAPGAAAAAAALLAAAAHLEAARARQTYGDVSDSKRHLDEAARALGVEVSVTGALGRRTAHQVDPKAQLVASLSAVGGGAGGAAGSAAAGGAGTAAAGAGPELDVPVSKLQLDDGGVDKEMEGLEDDSGVFAAPVIEGAAPPGAAQPGAPPRAPPRARGASGAEQALLLGWAAQVRRATSADELQQWEMAPYIEAVLVQPRSQWALQQAARLLKARHERTRGRTRERALLALERLCAAAAGGAGGGGPGADVRRAWAFGVAFPLWPLLRKELAELHIAMGFPGPALSIYEDLHMWDQLIVCYQLLGKKAAALDAIHARLEATPDDAKLWCALGDVTGDASHYETAWLRSGRRSARARRSAARAALKQKDWPAAAAHFEAALALSPLHPDCWFSLGYCYLRTERQDKARQAFTKLTQLEPDHGEGWANLAALWLQAGQWAQALNASSQAVRHKRESWQAWENYAHAALRAGAPLQAARGVGMVLQLSEGHRLPVTLLAGVVEALEQEGARLGPDGGGANGAAHGSTGGSQAADQQEQQQQEQQEAEEEEEAMEAPDELLGLLSLSQSLPGSETPSAADGAPALAGDAAAAAATHAHAQAVAAAGAALKAATAAPGAPAEVWGLLGRWYALAGEAVSAKEALLKHVRALQGSSFARDRPAFEAMAGASLRLADAYARLGAPRELAAARMHLRGVLRQSEAEFGGAELHAQLAAKLAEVEAAEAAAKAAALGAPA